MTFAEAKQKVLDGEEIVASRYRATLISVDLHKMDPPMFVHAVPVVGDRCRVKLVCGTDIASTEK